MNPDSVISKKLIGRPQERRREEAARWFVTLQHAELSERVLKSWKKWEAIPENRQAFDAVERLWQVAEGVPELPVASHEERAEDDYNGSVPIPSWRSTRAAGSTVSAMRRTVFRTLGLAAAVAAVAIALGTVPFLQPYFQSFWGNPSDRTVVIETGLGEHKQIVFEDGSRIQLGAQTSITANFTKSTRSVALDRGEAHFKVARDPKRPFEVSAAGGTITAVGTAFNVQHRQDSDVVVTVSEGIVDVAPPPSIDIVREAEGPQGSQGPNAEVRRAAQRVTRGHAVTYNGQGQISPVRLAEVDLSIAWRNGRFKYASEPLKHVIEDVNRYSRRQFILGDSAVGDLLYSGTVFESDIDEWVAGLEQTFPQIEVTQSDDVRVLLRTRIVDEKTRP